MHTIGIARSTSSIVARRAVANGVHCRRAPSLPTAVASVRSRSISTSPSQRNVNASPPPIAEGSPSTSTPASSDAPKKPRKVNPYRLPSLPTFLASFAPLHAAGWRLDSIPGAAGETGAAQSSAPGTTSHNAATDLMSGADLQDRRMTRAAAFPATREGWRALTDLVARVSQAVEDEDHHPTITVAPYSDLSASMRDIVTVSSDEAGYVLHVSTHTHTPLPPLGAEGAAFEGKPRPGVTYKDLKLAERIEAMVADQ